MSRVSEGVGWAEQDSNAQCSGMVFGGGGGMPLELFLKWYVTKCV